MFRNLTITKVLVAVFACLVCTLQARASADFRSVARLFGSSTVRGKAVYEERIIDASTMQRLKVELEHGTPDKSYGVRINGVMMGTITLNGLGEGELEFRTLEYISDPDQIPLPDGFPRMDAGDLVTVGASLGGVFYETGDDTAQRYRLEGEFEGAGSVHGNVRYLERFKDGALERIFKVEIEDAHSGTTFAVRVRGKVVGSITTNSLGRGQLELRTAAFIDSPSDGQPMPNSFPSLKDGEVVTIGTMTSMLILDV